MQTISVTAHSQTPPPDVVALRKAIAENAGATNSTVLTCSAFGSKQLYAVPPTLKPRSVKVLVDHSLARLASFGIPDLNTWDVEVSELDYGYFQVAFTNKLGAELSVVGISMTENRCGVILDHGLAASNR